MRYGIIMDVVVAEGMQSAVEAEGLVTVSG